MTPLHHIGDFFRQLLLQVPLGAVRAVFLLILVALLVWVLFLPRSQVTRSPDSGPAENLKLWAALALLLQLLIYALL